MLALNKTQVFQWWEFQKPGFMDLMQMPSQMGKSKRVYAYFFHQ